MRIAVCDDERVYREAIAEAVEKWCERRQDVVVASSGFASSEDLLVTLGKGERFDLIFLDIQIPGEMSGLELAEAIRAFDDATTLVFVTNYAEYACAGYQVNALRYLCKPVRAEQILECMDIAYGQCLYDQKQVLTLNTPQGTYALKTGNILYIESRDHFLEIHETVRKETLLVRMSQNQFHKDLPDGLLVRCHRSFVVNILYVRKLLRAQVILANGTQVPIGAQYRDTLRAVFDKYYQGG
ncbi:LytR/AlgR family response regulator transcription factor [Bacillota bacterium Meth-B3]